MGTGFVFGLYVLLKGIGSDIEPEYVESYEEITLGDAITFYYPYKWICVWIP